MKDEHTDEPAQFDPELQRWYRKMKQEQPGPELDEKIIAMAKRATDNAPKDNVVRVEHSFWRQYRWPLSSAASVMLVVTLLLLNPEVPQDVLRDDAMPVMMQMSEPVEVQGGQAGEEQALKAVAPRGMSVKPDGESSDVNGTATQRTTSQASEPQSQKGAAYRLSDTLEKQPSLIKSSTQREAVISAKQALNHLVQLVDSKQWDEAKKLALKIEKQYPQLGEPSHPQHQIWNELRVLLKQH
ncbi:hypothetical protein EKG38_12730 [Shewanella canadensis]|uniref:Uncharacterized protein n=1 Tax=Shewanella canadensis TaxID=271096 RepID=A0A431WRX9_9GAMM|nr:hypothetical protein [Shewanella canadensis]RTR38382.1 hypothetical protein EKG38_12730 [Shewanella canadensis]